MPYIGKEPTTGNFVYADDITTSSTNTYNILVGGVAFSPESANHLIVSLNGVIQKANTSFSVSGSQITFLPSSGTLSSTDSIDFILILGSVNDVGVATTVSDSAITKSKLNLISDRPYIFNLGHGILPETSQQNLTDIISYIREKKYGISNS